ncbi:class I tRNA ligase family protein, partial [Acinetobacter baumannii]
YDYCDKYIEKAKPRLQDNQSASLVIFQVLVNALASVLHLLHPIMPFITEDLWQQAVKPMLGVNDHDALMTRPYPEVLGLPPLED